MTSKARGRRGAGMVELALTFTAMFYLTLGMIEGARLAYANNSLPFLANQGARFASVRGSASGQQTDPAGVASHVRAQAVGLSTGDLAVNTTFAAYTPGSQVTVAVTYTFRPMFPGSPFSFASGMNLSATSRTKISQ